jgi:hypothetical protein
LNRDFISVHLTESVLGVHVLHSTEDRIEGKSVDPVSKEQSASAEYSQASGEHESRSSQERVEGVMADETAAGRRRERSRVRIIWREGGGVKGREGKGREGEGRKTGSGSDLSSGKTPITSTFECTVLCLP